MQKNSWLYHYYMMQSRLQYGFSYQPADLTNHYPQTIHTFPPYDLQYSLPHLYPLPSPEYTLNPIPHHTIDTLNPIPHHTSDSSYQTKALKTEKEDPSLLVHYDTSSFQLSTDIFSNPSRWYL